MKDEDKTKEQLIINEEVSKMGEKIRKTGIDIIGDAPRAHTSAFFTKSKKI